jgi:putative oxidoreductase
MTSHNVSQLLFGRHTVDGPTSMGLLVLRLLAGSAMALHGAPKMLTPTSWMGPDSPVPGVLQLLAAVAEFGGGIAWVLGLVTPLATLGVVVTMLVGIVIGHLAIGDPFIRLSVAGVPPGLGIPFAGLPTWLVRAGGRSAAAVGSGSSELATLFTAISALLLLTGPGRFSLDAVLSRALARRRAGPRSHPGEPVIT